MNTHLVISLLGSDRPGLTEQVARAVADCGGSVQDCRITVMGAEFVALVLVSGNWSTLAKLETHVEKLARQLDLHLHLRRTQHRQRLDNTIPYAVEVIALEQPGIIGKLAAFFNGRTINIEELSGRSYPAPHTNAPMFAVNIVIAVPAQQHIATLREDFMDFCDDLNLDAIIEPVKGI